MPGHAGPRSQFGAHYAPTDASVVAPIVMTPDSRKQPQTVTGAHPNWAECA
jgi:hypothetical protein